MNVEDLVSHSESLRALARRLVQDAAAADDVIQEACLAALRRPPPGDVSVRRWLAAVVRNLSMRRRRTEARRHRRERAAAKPEAVRHAVETVERAEIHRALLDELLALEEPYRTALLLRFVDGCTHAEIASRLSVARGTVSARLSRGLKLLRGRLDRRFGGSAAWCIALLALGPRSSAATMGVLAVSVKKSVTLAAVALIAAAVLVSFPGHHRRHLGRGDCRCGATPAGRQRRAREQSRAG
jgi:RNA polymerase sigma-70 factor (ECF subfamily)